MTPAQTAALDALSRCRFAVGSYAKRFVRSLHGSRATLTPRQASFLVTLTHEYRRQIGEVHAADLVLALDAGNPPPSGATIEEGRPKVTERQMTRLPLLMALGCLALAVVLTLATLGLSGCAPAAPFDTGSRLWVGWDRRAGGAA